MSGAHTGESVHLSKHSCKTYADLCPRFLIWGIMSAASPSSSSSSSPTYEEVARKAIPLPQKKPSVLCRPPLAPESKAASLARCEWTHSVEMEPKTPPPSPTALPLTHETPEKVRNVCKRLFISGADRAAYKENSSDPTRLPDYAEDFSDSYRIKKGRF